MFQPSFAEDSLNLVGTWKGVSSPIFIGSTGHFTADKAGVNWGKDTELTLVFEEQRGNDFVGKRISKNRSEQFIGSISLNNKDIIMVDEEGTAIMTVRDENTIDNCYSHIVDEKRFASCWVLRRVK
jgi:hypothetical protein